MVKRRRDQGCDEIVKTVEGLFRRGFMSYLYGLSDLRDAMMTFPMLNDR